MQAYRDFIDTNILASIMQIPNTFNVKKFEVIAIPMLDKPSEMASLQPRFGWDEAFAKYVREGEDEMLLPEYLDSESEKHL